MVNVIFLRRGFQNKAKNKEFVQTIDKLGWEIQEMKDNQEVISSKDIQHLQKSLRILNLAMLH